jgi:secreted protein with Ig-like and vWFA domain
MVGYKLALLKQAMSFVIDRLGPRDRLSIVAFECEARRILGLTTRMSDGGKATAKAAVESLVTQAGTDTGGGLRVAAEVLDGRRRRNSGTCSVILLSDGKGNHNYHHPMCISGISRYGGLAPQSLRCTAACRYPPPVHMLGLGMDHDAETMHAIASVTRGTFSAVIDKEEAVVQDLFAQCIGGLRSVAVQDTRVVLECLHPGVKVRDVKAASGPRRWTPASCPRTRRGVSCSS